MCLDPLKEIQGMKKRRDYTKPLMYLVLASVFMGLSSGLGFNVTYNAMPTMIQGSSTNAYAVGGAVAVVTFFVVFFISWIYSLGMNILGGKGKLYEGLITLVYPVKLISAGILISTLASLFGPISWLVSFVALAFFGMLAYATVFRATKEVFKVDMITAFVGITVLIGVIMLAFYGTALFGMITSMPMAGSFMP